MKILIFTQEFPPYVGGAGRYSAGLAKGLAQLDHEVTVLAPRYEIDSRSWDLLQPYRVVRTSASRSAPAVLLRVCRRSQPELVFVTENKAHQTAAVAFSLWAAAPYALTVHGTEIYQNLRFGGTGRLRRLRKPLLHRLFQRAKIIFSGTHWARSLLLEHMPTLASRTAAVPYGIDTEALPSPDPRAVDELRRSLSIEGPVILTVARLIPDKGVDMVLRALPRLLQDIPALKYVIVGEGPDRDRLEGLAHDLRAQGSVVFAGRVSDADLGKYYDLCDVFVMVSREGSRSEGFGLVYAEAAFFQKPSVAGRTGGVPEAVIDGQSGLLVDSHDPDAVAGAIGRLLWDTALARRLGNNGHSLVLEVFNIRLMAAETLRLALA